MKIRLTKPLPQPEYGRVIPAGVIIDAPPALSGRLLRQGIGKPLHDEETPRKAAEAPEMRSPTRKKVKRNA
ncbi:MAG: hypothetical protein IJ917_01900 [Firmicutes bacterium]|nr:hypothetical protein [Bacillota bacterium]